MGVYREIRRAAERLAGETARTLQNLIRIPSPSCGEGEAVGFIRREMEEIGFDGTRIDAMGNLIGRLGSGAVSVAFDAHIDVVDVPDARDWSHDPYGGEIAGGRVYGRGACDQKGAIASLLAAARIIKEKVPAIGCTVYIVVSVQEEDCEGLSWCHLIEEEGVRPDAVVITEPSGLALARGQKGKVQMTVETTGVASHGSAPQLGVNAIYAMAPIIAGIEDLNGRLPSAPPFGRGTVTVSRVESRSPSLCSVPDGCRIYLDRRLTAGETKEGALAQIESIAAPHGGRVSIPVYAKSSYTGLEKERESYYPSWLMDEESTIVAAGREAFQALYGSPPDVRVWNFSTNGIATAGIHGIPTIGFGPGNPVQAHTADEFVPVDHLTAAAAFYAAFTLSFMGVLRTAG